MTSDEKFPWGGKRPNQTGRPPARPGVRRVGFHCMVDPATRDLIKQIGQRKKLSIGQVVDELALEGMERYIQYEMDPRSDPNFKSSDSDTEA
jgi:hypothetical protein